MARPLIPLENLSADMQKFFDVLNESSDLGVVLIATSYLDACLGAMLHRFFIVDSKVSNKLLDIRGPLGTFSARSDATYALELVGKTLYQDLGKIGEIRNEFAHHHLEHDFQVPVVAKLCRELKYIESDCGVVVGEPSALPMAGPRDKFVKTAVIISQLLLTNGLGIKRQGSTT